jgi:hypothetical protein
MRPVAKVWCLVWCVVDTLIEAHRTALRAEGLSHGSWAPDGV